MPQVKDLEIDFYKRRNALNLLDSIYIESDVNESA